MAAAFSVGLSAFCVVDLWFRRDVLASRVCPSGTS